jgi:hypothetical protein
MQCGLFYQLPCAPRQDTVTRYQETMEQIVYAEELGFDIAWLAELHFYQPFSILSSPLILAAALAQRTQRIRLGTAVVLLPLQHPLRVAEDAATVGSDTADLQEAKALLDELSCPGDPANRRSCGTTAPAASAV